MILLTEYAQLLYSEHGEDYLFFNIGVEGALANQILSGILKSVEPKAERLKDD